MQYSYKTHKLLDEGVNFGNVYSDKQEIVKEMTGFDFNLSNIVSFLKKETDNFTKTIDLALDLDRHIYAIYLKWLSSEKPTPRAVETVVAEQNNESVSKLMVEISDLNDLIEMQSDKKMIKKLKAEISDLNDLIEMQS